MSLVLLVVGLAVVVGAWTFLFRGPGDTLWWRTLVSAAAVGGIAAASLAWLGLLDDVVGPVDGTELAIGVGVGVGWLVATQIGHRLLCGLVPGFLGQVIELYRLQAGDRSSLMIGPVVAMALAEELFFRGFVQGVAGLTVAVVVYGTVQGVARNWALVVAGLLSGAVWGTLCWWRGGLVAAAIAHLIWTSSLLWVWPLRGCGRDGGAPDVTAAVVESPMVTRSGG